MSLGVQNCPRLKTPAIKHHLTGVPEEHKENKEMQHLKRKNCSDTYHSEEVSRDTYHREIPKPKTSRKHQDKILKTRLFKSKKVASFKRNNTKRKQLSTELYIQHNDLPKQGQHNKYKPELATNKLLEATSK